MKNEKLIQVLKKVLENKDLDENERQIIQNFISKAENEGVSAGDVVDLAKNLLDIVKLIQSFLE